MNRKSLANFIGRFTKPDLVAMLVLSLIVLYLNLMFGIACLILVALVSAYHTKTLSSLDDESLNRIFGIEQEPLYGAASEESPAQPLNEDLVKELEDCRRQLANTRPCLAILNIDNYDELLASSPAEDQSAISAELDRKIRSWAQQLSASVTRTRSKYVIQFEQKYLEEQKRANFEILNNMHEIETGADFPTSISIGISCGEPTYAALQSSASDALDLALGRGGDQVVIKSADGEIAYFGGSLPSYEKRNKGKSRIMAHAVAQLVQSSDRVFIMGHSRPDMDCFGAAIGMYRFAKAMGKQADIVMDDPGSGIDIIYKEAVKQGCYSFITGERAQVLISPASLVIVVDTHISFITECPELLQKVQKVVVIDHHRRSKDAIENPTIFHQETYASSASELVTELLQYGVDKNNIEDFDAAALLAGITVDTKNFTQNTGVRTFEAAAWLRRMGADSQEVHNFFKVKLDFFKKKYNVIANAEILEGGVAVAYTKDRDEAMQIIVSQAADEILEMRGVTAVFAAGRGINQTMVSARSMGSFNVQTVMEKIGGGGHMNIAAAQVDESPEEAIATIVKILRESGLM